MFWPFVTYISVNNAMTAAAANTISHTGNHAAAGVNVIILALYISFFIFLMVCGIRQHSEWKKKYGCKD